MIGQAGTPGHCATHYCTSLAGTSDYGRTWYGVSAPLDRGAGRQQRGQPGPLPQPQRRVGVRPAAVGHPRRRGDLDAGEDTTGMRVTDLETAGEPRVRAVRDLHRDAERTTGPHCTSVLALLVRRRAATSGAGARARPRACAACAAGSSASASLVLTGGTGGQGYLLAPSGELLSGPLTGAAWTVADRACRARRARPGRAAQPSGALLAADSGRLVLVLHQRDQPDRRRPGQAGVRVVGRRRALGQGGRRQADGIATSVALQAQDEPGGAGHRRGPVPVGRRRPHLAAAQRPAAPRPGPAGSATSG